MRRCLLLFVLFVAAAIPMRAVSTTVVISQVYGAGGNSGALLNDDFVELFNLSSTNQILSGYALQYISATGTTETGLIKIPTITLAPGEHYLVVGTAGTTGAALPTADLTDAGIALAATAGKIFLTNNQTALTVTLSGAVCSDPSIVDFVGYGTTANCYEGAAAAPAPSTTLADLRANNGCTDTDQNGTDFTAATPNPRNSGVTYTPCNGSTVPVTPSGPLSLTSLFKPNTALAAMSALLTATVTPGTNPASSGVSVSADFSALGGSSTQPLYDDGTHGDVAAGDNIYSYSETVPYKTSSGAYSVPVKVTDAQLRSATVTSSILVQSVPYATGDLLLSAAPTAATPGSTILFNAVAAGTQPVLPTGTVIFSEGTTVLGSGMLVAGVVPFSTTTLAAGTHTITAYYSGDAVYLPFAPVTATVTISSALAADFNLTLSNLSLIANGGDQHVQTVVNVGMVNGFNQTVNLACSGLPSGASCRFSPATLAASGSSILYIAIDGATAQLHRDLRRRGVELALLFGMPLLFLSRNRRLTRSLLGVFLLGAMLLGVSGCSVTSTAPGTSNVTVTATAGSVTHTATLSLVAQ